MTSKTVQPETDQKKIQGGFSPVSILGVMILGIAMAEVIAMIVVYSFRDLPYYQQVMIDAGIMTLIIFPILYYLSFRPILRHIQMRQQAEEELRKAYEDLELRVEARTEDLRLANLELEEEITVRKQVEESLRGSEERYRSLFNSMTEGFALHEILYDDSGLPCNYRFLELNPSFERLTGLKRETAIGRTVKEILPDIESNWIETYGKVALTGEPLHFESYTASLKRWYEIYCYSPVKDQFATLFFDISENKQAEEQLRYQAALLSSVDDAIIAADAQYRLTEWNSAAESLYGWKAEEVLGRNGLEIIRTEWPEKDSDEMRRTIAMTGHWRGEATQIRKDGTRFTVEVSSIVIQDAEGQIIGYVSVNRDITQRKLAEETLRQSQLDLYRAQEVGQIGSWRLDVRENELTWSDENHRMFGIPKGTAMTYETFLSVVHPDDRSYVDMKWNAALQGESYDIEHRIVVDGATKWIHEKAYLEFDPKNMLQGAFGIAQDITKLKRAEEILRRLNRTLRALSNTNQAMIRSTSERRYLDDVCKIVVEDCGHSMVWIGYAQDDEEKSVVPVASAGFEDGYLESLNISWADCERGDGPTGTAIRTGKPSRCNNMLIDANFAPWREQAMKHGYASSLVLPLIAQGTAFGAINIYSHEPDFFSREEELLLTELAGDLVYGIQAIRLREAHAQVEAELRIAHDELELRVQERTEELAAANQELSNKISERMEIERQLRIQTTAMEAAADGIMITDTTGIILWANPALLALTGYSQRELIGQPTRLLNSGQHDKDYYRQMWAIILAGQMWQGETINRRRDGTLYVEEQTIAPVIGEAGKISHFISIKHDISEQKQAKAELELRNLELQALSETEHEQRQLAETLRASAQALSQSLDLDIVIRTLLRHLRALVGADTASAIFPEGETNLGVRAVDGYEGWTNPGRLLEIKIESESNPLFRRLLATRQTLLIPNTDLELDRVMYPGMEPIHSEMYVPVKVEDRLIGVVGVGKFEANYFTQEHIQWAEALTGQAAVAIQNAWLFDQVRAGRERMQFLSRRLVEIQESERRYIARELHDHAGQNLTSLMLSLGAMEKDADNTAFVRTRAAELKVMTDHVLEDLHRLAINLRPASLDHLGLSPALEQLIKAFTQDTHLPIKLKTVDFGEDDRLSQEVETTLYRVAQEAITNAVRHAHASRIDVMLERRDDSMLVIVEDDGMGFDVVRARENGRLGLLGMQERIEMLGGNLTIESTLGSGTTLFVEVPCAHSDITR